MCVQWCPTLCNLMDYKLPGSFVHGILKVRMLECVAIPSPEDLSDPGIEPGSPVAPALQVDSLPLSRQGGPQISSTGSWTIGAVLHGLK